MPANRLTQLSFLLIMAAMTTVTFAYGPPNGKGGGGEGGGEPAVPGFTPHPDVEYQLSLISYPHNETSASGYAKAMNDSGCAVGNYHTAEAGTHSWYYNPELDAAQAFDLRDLSNVELAAGARFHARGMNDLGLIVGGIVYANGDVDGFSLDANTGELDLLPTDPGWNYAVGIEVNNNGDILGRIYRLDGTIGNYLFNPGSEGVAPTFEIINVPNVRAGDSHLNQAANGEQTVVVGVTNPDSTLFIHPKGEATEITNITTLEAQVNDSRTILGRTLETFEIQVSRRKSETVTESRVYRLTDTSGLEILSDDTPAFAIEDLNNSGVAVGRHIETVSSDSGTQHFFYVLSHVESLGVIDVGGSVADADKVTWEALFRDEGFSVDIAVNNAGPLGAGQVIGASDSAVSMIFLLTPVSK